MDQTVRNISDTALWAAIYRAREADRPDALFRDPYARRLAGSRGDEIADAMPFSNRHTWSWVTRTWLFDKCITEQIQQGADMVVNLAAGLDARPYRMSLPASLQWVEVDLPGILDYKEQILSAEKPSCALRRIRLDLADAAARRTLFHDLGSRSRKALVITEGFVIYLPREGVADFASDLATAPGFAHWVLDIVSPGLLQMLQKNLGSHLASGGASLQFAPVEGAEFFQPCGWKPEKVDSMLKAAAGLRRLPFLMRFAALLPERRGPQGSRPWSGVCLFSRQQNSAPS